MENFELHGDIPQLILSQISSLVSVKVGKHFAPFEKGEANLDVQEVKLENIQKRSMYLDESRKNSLKFVGLSTTKFFPELQLCILQSSTNCHSH